MNLYIHVPFCAQRCNYCDFYTQTLLGLRVGYIEALLSELRSRRNELYPHETLNNIYLGGGTPSLLSIAELERIFSHIYELYPISSDAEITLEANPDDITIDYAQGLKSLPVNRVSMGTQSFQEEDLRFLNRRHNRRQVYDAVDRLRHIGIDNLSLDLIYGLPNQTAKTWADNLEQICSLDVPHISAYHLIYEEGTALTRLRDLGKVQEVSEADSVMFFRMLIDRLTQGGYEHYEISNFAKPGRYARLNTGYWLGERYIGLGPAAHSYDGKVRSHNVASIKVYTEGWKDSKRVYEAEELSVLERQHEYLMTRLRTQWGVSLRDYASLFSEQAVEDLLRRADSYIRRGDLLLSDDVLRLSPSGIFISDAILVELFD